MTKNSNLKKPFHLWLTGLPSAGKTTTAKAISKKLDEDYGVTPIHLDGDVMRKGLNSDLGFTVEDRAENLRRVTYISEILVTNGVPVISSFVSPFTESRDFARVTIPNFIEVYIATPIDICIDRDVKGLYEKAKEGIIENMTGYADTPDGRYDIPSDPEITLKTEGVDLDKNVDQVVKYLVDNGFIEK